MLVKLLLSTRSTPAFGPENRIADVISHPQAYEHTQRAQDRGQLLWRHYVDRVMADAAQIVELAPSLRRQLSSRLGVALAIELVVEHERASLGSDTAELWHMPVQHAI